MPNISNANFILCHRRSMSTTSRSAVTLFSLVDRLVCFFFRSRIYRFCVALRRLIRFDVIRFVSKSFLLSQINTSNQFMDADIQTTIVASSTIEIDLWRSSIDCSIIRLLFALWCHGFEVRISWMVDQRWHTIRESAKELKAIINRSKQR